jgi:hypothetical protein
MISKIGPPAIDHQQNGDNFRREMRSAHPRQPSALAFGRAIPVPRPHTLARSVCA